MQTVGIADKVKWPAVFNALIGILLLTLWVITNASTGDGYNLTDPLFIAGCGFLGAGGVTLGVGYRAPAAAVEFPDALPGGLTPEQREAETMKDLPNGS